MKPEEALDVVLNYALEQGLYAPEIYVKPIDVDCYSLEMACDDRMHRRRIDYGRQVHYSDKHTYASSIISVGKLCTDVLAARLTPNH